MPTGEMSWSCHVSVRVIRLLSFVCTNSTLKWNEIGVRIGFCTLNERNWWQWQDWAAFASWASWLSMNRIRIQAAPILSAGSAHLETETVIQFWGMKAKQTTLSNFGDERAEAWKSWGRRRRYRINPKETAVLTEAWSYDPIAFRDFHDDDHHHQVSSKACGPV